MFIKTKQLSVTVAQQPLCRNPGINCWYYNVFDYSHTASTFRFFSRRKFLEYTKIFTTISY